MNPKRNAEESNHNYEIIQKNVELNRQNKNLTKRRSLNEKHKFLQKLNTGRNLGFPQNRFRPSDLNRLVDCREQASKEEDCSQSESQLNSHLEVLRNNPQLESFNLAKLANQRKCATFTSGNSSEHKTVRENARRIISHNDVYNQFYTPHMYFNRAKTNNFNQKSQNEMSFANLNWTDRVEPRLKGGVTRPQQESPASARVLRHQQTGKPEVLPQFIVREVQKPLQPGLLPRVQTRFFGVQRLQL